MFNDLLSIKRAKSGINEDFVHLMKKNEKYLYNMARKFLNNEEDIADCLQETMIDAFKNIKNLKKDRYFKTWLCRILINNCHAILEKNNKTIDFIDWLPEAANPNSESFELREHLLALDVKYRLPLVLYYYNGYSIKEISRMLGLPINTTKTRLARAKAKLKVQQSSKGEV
ncbi:RNA polymerase sigma factor [Enterococcus sp.]|uniref:RNA polymerase sigma factor n=1 Tax=Enterococcus sp. TaxID=35783 RepID=UPI002FC8288E